MQNLYDSTFYMHVAVVAILVIAFILILKPWKGPAVEYDEKYDRMADDIIRSMTQCRTHEELKLYEDEADDFYLNNYEFIGHDKSIEIYMRMINVAKTMRSTIEKENRLTRDRISS